MSLPEAIVTVLRVWVGVVMLAHGLNHARSLAGTEKWFAKKGFKAPAMNARMSAATELAIGLGLISGLLTSVAAAGVAATLVVAFWAIHRFAGFFVFHRPDEGYEYVVTLIVVAFVIAGLGPGPVSLDAVLDLDDRLSGTTGVLIVAAGLVAGALQLMLSWRRPADGPPTS
jgi:putative oxidoreductase